MRELILNAFQQCLKQSKPAKKVAQALNLHGSRLDILSSSNSSPLHSTDLSLSSSSSTRFYIAAFGKAALNMCEGIDRKIPVEEAIILAPDCEEKKQISTDHFPFPFSVHYGGRNNLPDENSVEITKKLLEFLKARDSSETIFLFLISGGGSALLCSPVEGVTLHEKQETIRILASSGADIRQLNIIRQALSNVKGGKLLKNIPKSKAISLIIADIVGNPLEYIASGPTVIQEPEKRKNPMEVIHELNVLDKLPKSVAEKLSNNDENFNQQPLSHANVNNFIISSNRDFLKEFQVLLGSSYESFIATNCVTGNATTFGGEMAKFLMGKEVENAHLIKLDRASLFPGIVLFGGETTVQIRGPGKGGRNQELALSFLVTLLEIALKSPTLTSLPNFVFMAAGSDGQDGPTDADGAILTTADIEITEILSTLEHGREALAISNSYGFWNSFNEGKCHLKTGLTGTNVMDVIALGIY